MKLFAELYINLDSTNKTNEKVAFLTHFFQNASDEDKLAAIAILSGRRPKRWVNSTQLRTLAAQKAGIPLWLFEECYSTVGDLSETIALLCASKKSSWKLSLYETLKLLSEGLSQDEKIKENQILEAWAKMDRTECLIFNKLSSGGFRMGVSQKLMTKALHQTTQIPEDTIAERLIGTWDINNTTYQSLIIHGQGSETLSRPYPFCLAHALEAKPETLGSPTDWQVEWKWDGIRAQIVCRNGKVFIWSRGEEIINDQFPELQMISLAGQNMVLDGEIVALNEIGIPSFSKLQNRLGRKNPSKKWTNEVPVKFIAFDLLELSGIDLRNQPLLQRMKILQTLFENLKELDSYIYKVPPKVSTWEEITSLRNMAREHHAEGIMLKHTDSTYQSGRKKGVWWKWKLDPYTVDAVMLYAQSGHGRRSTLFTDYTFGIWHEGQLLPFTKAYSGLTDKEFEEISAFVRINTIQKFGPVRQVKPELVFEIGFEGIRKSNRHKSGVALRFPRMIRWRRDKTPNEASTLTDLQALLEM